MKDEQAVGKIVIEKTDQVTGKPIEGVVFEVRDKAGKVLDTLKMCIRDRDESHSYHISSLMDRKMKGEKMDGNLVKGRKRSGGSLLCADRSEA